MNKESGIILPIVLCAIMIILAMAVSMNRRTGVDISLTQYALGQLRARHLASAGWEYTLYLVRQGMKNRQAGAPDTVGECGIRLAVGQTPKDLFGHVALGPGYFEVEYPSPDQRGLFLYGPSDEERRINLNALDSRNYKILTQLLIVVDVDPEEADHIAAAVVDWHDKDSTALLQPDTTEEEFYSQPYRCKNRPFDDAGELLLIKGVTPAIFNKVKDLITVFPQEPGGLAININTAPLEVLRALGRSLTDVTHTAPEDADHMARKIVEYRRGKDGVDATADDRVAGSPDDMDLDADEKAIFLTMQPLTVKVSKYFRIKARGVDAATGVRSRIEGVVSTDDLSVLYWQRD